MSSDLGGPEKPLGVDWSVLIRQDLKPDTPIRPIYTPAAVGPNGRVRPRHRMVVMLHEAGWKAKDIANATGYTQSRVGIILNSRHPELLELREKFASQVAENALDVNSRLRLYANEMLTIMVGHARNDKEHQLSRLAARDILQMAGFTPVKKIFQANANIPVEDLKRLVSNIQDANEVVLKAEEWRVKDPAA